MNHVQQYELECMLASVAMITDQDYFSIRLLPEATGHMKTHRWKDHFGPTGEHWTDHTDKFLLSQGIEPFPKWIKDGVASLPERPLDGRNVRGRGILVVQWKDDQASHAVAFEDGIIYDPGMSQPYPLKEWPELPYVGGWVRMRMSK